MNICVITSNYPAPGHQMNVFVEQLVDEMVTQGVNVEVIAPQSVTHSLLRHDSILPKLDYRKVGNKQYRVWRPYYISLGNCPSWLESILSRIRFRGVKKILNRLDYKPDAIYGHFWSSVVFAKEYALKHEIPMFVACGEGDNALEDMVETISPEDKDKLVRAVNGVISVSSENKRKCIEFGLAKEENIIVLPNSVDTSLFNNKVGKNIRSLLNVKDDDFLVAFTGSFIHRKGSARLSDAIDKLNDSHIKVMFIGNKRPADDATPTCSGICHIGGLDHQYIPDYLKSADIFCLPTLKEGCSNAIVEALACGLPVISADRPFNYDVLDDSNSIMIDPMNVDEIADAIKKLKNDINLRNRLSQGALRKASSLQLDVRASKIICFIKKHIV